MKVDFINTDEWGIDTKLFDPFIDRLKGHVPDVDGDLNVVFVQDDEIHQLNKEHRGKDKPTDVLSFSYLDAPDFGILKLIGELYISVPTARRQAKEQGETIEEQLSKLFVHGCLHVFGFDHVKNDDYLKMYYAECAVLERKLPYVEEGE